VDEHGVLPEPAEAGAPSQLPLEDGCGVRVGAPGDRGRRSFQPPLQGRQLLLHDLVVVAPPGVPRDDAPRRILGDAGWVLLAVVEQGRLVVLDGVFARGPDGAVHFHEATQLEEVHWLELQRVIQRRVLRHFRARGFLDDDDALGMLTWRGSGGFSVDASVRIEGEDRTGVERLLRYCARPPFALERLHALGETPSLASPEARLLYQFPRPTPDGRTQIVLSPLQLLERLARFVPPPRIHRHRYHGALAPHARLRPAVIAIGTPVLQSEASAPLKPACTAGSSAGLPDPPPRPASQARIHWAVLLERIYEALPLLCPACGGQMSILAFLTDPPVVSAILLHLDLPHRPPPLSPARGPPQGDLLLDQSPTFDPADPEPDPDFQFDQSPPPTFED